MAARTNTGPLTQAGLALLLALVLTPVIRGVTIDLNRSIGHVWPFSLGHCHTRATPGCDMDIARLAAAGAPPTIKQATR